MRVTDDSQAVLHLEPPPAASGTASPGLHSIPRPIRLCYRGLTWATECHHTNHLTRLCSQKSSGWARTYLDNNPVVTKPYPRLKRVKRRHKNPTKLPSFVDAG